MLGKGIGDLVRILLRGTVSSASLANHHSQLGDFAIIAEGFPGQSELIHGLLVAHFSNEDVEALARMIERNAMVRLHFEADLLKSFHH